jgi:hypothetical protein
MINVCENWQSSGRSLTPPRDLPNVCTGLQRLVRNSSKSQMRDRRIGGLAQRYSADAGVEFRPGHVLS